MKKNIILVLILVVFVANQLLAQTHVSGSIATNTVWTPGGSPYVVDDDVTVELGVSLTIQAGVIVKFNDFWDGITVLGTLNAIGTDSNPIIFTSIADDAHGGDTNGDGDATVPGPDQWSTIDYHEGGTGTLQYCWISYGGGEYSANVHINESSVTVDHCTISNSAERGIWIGSASPDITNNLFENNLTQAIWAEGFDTIKTFSLINNIFHNNQWAVYANLTDETNDINLAGNVSTGAVGDFGRNGFGLAGSIAGNVSYT
ncbi:MAG TPA: hypothetical protein ENK85_08905, partial [Saprospiraceae bacterium]|nr:hypothetical protein [Saprospiraceae bacterium]